MLPSTTQRLSETPAAMSAHVPLAFAQVLHAPQLSLAQQVLSTQLLDVQSSSSLHDAPNDFLPGPQLMTEQTLVPEQSPSVVQL